jgi:hypothetical protein
LEAGIRPILMARSPFVGEPTSRRAQPSTLSTWGDGVLSWDGLKSNGQPQWATKGGSARLLSFEEQGKDNTVDDLDKRFGPLLDGIVKMCQEPR